MKIAMYFTLMSTLLLFLGCSDNLGPSEDKADNSATEEEIISADGIEERVFDLLNLDYPGLEEVKTAVEAGNKGLAAVKLLEYYRGRDWFCNPNIDLVTPPYITASDRNIADQALEYRFYVTNFVEKTEDGNDIYYSRLKNGAIDWLDNPTGGAAEYIYQLHRMQWMPVEAKVYRNTGDEKYAENMIEVYTDWIKTFPVPEGTVSNSTDPQWYGLQPAMRLQNQADILPFIINSVNFTPAFLTVFLTFMSDEAETIRQNYKTDNIYLTQVSSLTTAAVLFPEFRNASEWESDGLSRISQEIESQFLEDGVHVEMTPGYHISAIYNIYGVYKVLLANGKADKLASVSRLRSAAHFVMDLTYPGYNFDNFNDTGSASWTESTLTTNFKRYVEMFPDDEELAWMATKGSSGRMPSSSTKLYKTGGYYMMRSKWWDDALIMVLKNNNTYGRNLGHVHADNGTFSLFNNGRNFSPDPGYYSYSTSDPEVNEKLDKEYKATNAHNTMTLNGENISRDRLAGKFEGNFSGYSGSTPYEAVVVSNQSYPDLMHRRSVFFVNRKFFVIVDEGAGTGAASPVEVTFHLADADNVTVENGDFASGSGAYTTFTDGNNMMFKTFAETSDGYKVTTGTNHYSNRTNEESGTREWYRVSIDRKQGLAARFITVILPFSSSRSEVSAKFTDNGNSPAGTYHEDGVSVEVTVGGDTYNLSYSLK